ncbi:MAG: type IV secretion system DNA-binding domain-containing protein, partial [Rhodospirillaceae bacterium]|nr:type IV secretion system DNA-binding domain-containing protein [Rhodospirillaceae bacterium]MYJ70357.1 type IV secretion system DNA-binding domain-containing protein [Rhodospirillaceae bacterium]
FQAAMLFAAFTTVAVPAWTLWRSTSGAEWYAAGMVTLAETKLALGYEPDSGQEIRFEDGTVRSLAIKDIAVSVPALQARERILDELLASAWLGFKAGGGMIALFLAVFWWRGVQLGRQKRIRGAELVTSAELRRRVRPLHLRFLDRAPGSARMRPYSIAGIPYPERTETQHTIVSGTTGSGKTVLISDLVAQIRARGERCVIYDKMGSYTATFLDPARDVLMNPLDARAPRWSPFLEARGPRDFDMMAAALIPQQKDTVDPFWVTAARQLFANGAGVLRERGVKDNRVLVDHLLKTDLTALAQAMEGTVAQSIVDPENPKTALSVRAMLTANLAAFEFLPDEGEPFSIREWISRETQDGFLFLTSRGDQHASLRGLISTWLEIAVNAMLSLTQDDGRRIWVILDELPTLHQVPSLQPGLAESRQFGGCFVLGVQVASALRDLYGRNGAETISGLCGTRVVLAAPDRDTAQWSADSLGRSEIEEVAEGYSYGANTIRDGVSLTPRRELRALALPSEIMRLENLAGYLKFPGPFPVASIRLNYVARPKAARRFVPRGEHGAGPPARADDADAAAPARGVAPGCNDGIAILALPGDAGATSGKPSPGPEDAPGHGRLQGELDLFPLPGEAGTEFAPPRWDAGADADADGEETERPGDGSGECKGDGFGTEDTPPAPASGQDAADEPPAVIGDPATKGGDAASPRPTETAIPADKTGKAGAGSEPAKAGAAAPEQGAAKPRWY